MMKPIKVTLEQDAVRGPGYGVMSLEGLSVQDGLRYRVERNQKSAEHLQVDGQWGGAPVMQLTPVPQASEEGIVLFFGTRTIDALIKNNRAAYRIIVQDAAEQEYVGNIRIKGTLLGSGAQGNGAQLHSSPLPEAPPSVERPAPAPPAHSDAAVSTVIPISKENKSSFRRAVFIVLVIALLLGVLGGAWAWCVAVPLVPARSPCVVAGEHSATPKQPSAGKAGEDAYGRCLSLKKAGKLPEASAACQKAAAAGNIEAMKEMARMHDPATWSKATSPELQANWETATYWWKRAAHEGDRESKRHEGYNMAKYGEYEMDKEQGIELLKEARSAGDSEASALLKELGQ